MSKGNPLMGQARGKVGDLVFSRVNGQQVMRSKPAVVRNPRTSRQMVQRILMNTAAQLYSFMQPIVDHSFQGIAPGQQSMSAFMKSALKTMRTNMLATTNISEYRAVSPVGSNVPAMVAVEISRGTLPTVEVASVAADGISIVANGATYGDIISSLNVQRGDQLTFIQIVRKSEKARPTFHYARVILDPRNSDGSEAELSVPFIADGAINLPSPRNEGSFSALSVADNGLVVTFKIGAATATTLAGAVIVSRETSKGVWERSSQTLVLNDTITFNYTMGEALALLEAGALSFESDLYLNNAVQSGASSVTNGGSTEGGDVVTPGGGGDDDLPGGGE